MDTGNHNWQQYWVIGMSNFIETKHEEIERPSNVLATQQKVNLIDETTAAAQSSTL